MRLHNEFAVAAPLERSWETLLDVPRVAAALPGAALEPGGVGDDHRGRMTVKIGPVTAEYAGTARLEEIDEDRHMATFRVQGAGVQGTAAATIVGRLEPTAHGTRMVVETDLSVTGRAAQFGRGLMEDVAAATMAEFARRLEREVLAPSVAATGRGHPDDAETVDPAEPLDLGAAAWKPLVRRYRAPSILALLLAALLLLAMRRPVVVVIREP